MNTGYAATEPKREEIDSLQGPALLEFGTPWCGWCRRAQPLIAEALSAHPGVRHIKVADANGKRLGRWSSADSPSTVIAGNNAADGMPDKGHAVAI